MQLQLQGIEDDATAGGSELCFPLEPVLPDPDNFFFRIRIRPLNINRIHKFYYLFTDENLSSR